MKLEISDRFKKLSLVVVLGMLCSSAVSFGMDLDWKGQFRAESHWVYNYSLGRSNITNDATSSAGGGYYIPGGGSGNAYFHTLFLKLQPTLIVNDNVYIKSEWRLGDPVFGFFGGGVPYTSDQRNFFSNQSRGSTITAHRVWAELLTDVGRLQVGRAPMHWGLGIVWNSGDRVEDRYQSTGDMVRLISKFGSFTFSPAFIKISQGNNVGGACSNPTGAIPCTTSEGGGGVTDYSIALKYENLDEDFELGLNFIRRIGGSAQDTTFGYLTPFGTTGGSVFNIWDIYGKKKIGNLTFAGEVPVTTGTVGGANYSTFAVALESAYEFSNRFSMNLKAGRAPGQPNLTTGSIPSNFDAFFFHPGYNLGLIMFNYQLRNFAGPNTSNNPNVPAQNQLSPFDNSIVNANYLAVGANLKANRWNFRSSFIWANALQTAAATGQFYNYWTKQFVNYAAGPGQSSSIGMEWDLGASMQWDEAFRIDLDFGWFIPGDFYRFSNAANQNAISSLFATTIRAAIQF